MEFQCPVGKQAQFILTEPARINLLYGSVRSGKTNGVNIKWLHDIVSLPDGNMLMVGNTINSLYRNVIQDIKRLIGDRNVDFRRTLKEVNILGRTIWMEGADKEDSYERIEGESLLAAYVDEWTTIPESFTDMLLSRLSDSGNRLYGTCNAGSPTHYLYRRFIQRSHELNMRTWKFTLDDNPWIDSQYKADLISEYPIGTVFYDRYILGNWVSATGLVFQLFDRARHVVSSPPSSAKLIEARVGADYGTHNPTSFIMLEKYVVPGRHRPVWYATREYYWDSVAERLQKTDGDYSYDLAQFIAGSTLSSVPPRGGECATVGTVEAQAGERSGASRASAASIRPEPRVVGLPRYPTSIEVDPSAASFILQLQRDGMRKAGSARNDVLSGIRSIASMLARGDLFICSSCPWLIWSIENYTWDKSSSPSGNEMPMKVNDHPVDALRYIVNSL